MATTEGSSHFPRGITVVGRPIRTPKMKRYLNRRHFLKKQEGTSITIFGNDIRRFIGRAVKKSGNGTGWGGVQSTHQHPIGDPA